MGLEKVLSRTGREYCENTTVHGFAYWTGRTKYPSERLFWVLVTLIGFSCAGMILNTTITDWIEYPTGKSGEV